MNFFKETHLKPSTYKTYNRHLGIWLSLLPPEQNTVAFLYSHPYYSTVLLRKHLHTKNQNNARTVNTYIKALLSAVDANRHMVLHLSDEILAASNTRWKDLRHLTFTKAYAYRMEQLPSPGQATKSGSTLKLADLILARDALPDGSINKLLIGFYTHLPPARADYYATQIIPFGHTPTQPNYLFHDSQHSQVVLTDFKTNKYYKEIRHDLPPELHRQLVLSLQAQPRSYLFVNQRGHPFRRNGFIQWSISRLYEIFTKNLTLTMLRHIYISSLDFNSPPAQLIEIGRKMGHDISQQILYKWKDSD